MGLHHLFIDAIPAPGSGERYIKCGPSVDLNCTKGLTMLQDHKK